MAASDEESLARPHLLVVEPDPLTRWSLVTYLGRWYEVHAVAAASEAVPLLAQYTLHSIIVANDLPGQAADALLAQARAASPGMLAVRLITNAQARPVSDDAVVVEKPFELSTLAQVLRGEPVERPLTHDNR